MVQGQEARTARAATRKRREDQSVTEDAADESTTEEEIQAMSEMDPGEEERGKTMWLSEKVTSLGE